MKTILISLILLLPFGAMAQQDTISLKGAGKFVVTIHDIEKDRIVFTSGNKTNALPLNSLSSFYWAPSADIIPNSDKVTIKGGKTYSVTIKKVEDGVVHFTSGNKSSSIPESSLSSYYWHKHLFPVQNDNTIVIETRDSPEVAFKKIGMVLGEKGFGLLSTNETFRMINTDEKATEAGILKLTAFVKANEKPDEPTKILITCQTNSYSATAYSSYTPATRHTYGSGLSVIDSDGPSSVKLNQSKKLWKEALEVVKLYEGGAISYEER